MRGEIGSNTSDNHLEQIPLGLQHISPGIARSKSPRISSAAVSA